jgi:hypothetical protein
MTNTTLKIDQGALFAALNHDRHAMGLALALLEVMGHERVDIQFAHPNLNRDVRFHRDEFLRTLGVDVHAA